MMMKKMLLLICVMSVLVMALGTFASAEISEDGAFQYTILEDDTAELIGYCGDSAEVVLPVPIVGNPCNTAV